MLVFEITGSKEHDIYGSCDSSFVVVYIASSAKNNENKLVCHDHILLYFSEKQGNW